MYKKEKKVYLFLSILIVVIGIILPSIRCIYGSIFESIETKQYNRQIVGEILAGTKIEQEIYLPNNIKKYGIMFATYARPNSGSIKIELEQGDKKIEELLDVSSISDNSIYYLNIDRKKFDEGIAKLSITGIDGVEGNAITIYTSDDVSLGKLTIDGDELDRGIIQNIKYETFNLIAKIQILIFIVLIFCVSYIIYILNFTKENLKTSRILFFMTALTSFLILNIKAPILTFQVEPFAELANNFYINGTTRSMAENIMLPDAGYWPLLQRIVSIFVIKILRATPNMSVYLMQNFSIWFISIISALFCLDKFSKYGSRIFRFTISIIISTCSIVYIYYDSHSFINFSYYGIVFIILMSMINLNKISKKALTLIIMFSALICISKSYFVILIPIIILIYIFKRKQLTKRYKFYFSSILLANLVQIIYTSRNIDQWIKPNEKSLNILKLLKATIYHLVQQVIEYVYPKLSDIYNVQLLNIIFLMLMFLFCAFLIYYTYKVKINEKYILFGLLLLIFGTSMFNVVTTVWNSDVSFLFNHGEKLMRHSIFIQLGLIFITILTIYIIKLILEKKLYKDSCTNILIEGKYLNKFFKIVYLFMSIILISRFTIFDNNNIDNNKICFSDWTIYSKMFENDKYLIPINPHPWTLSKNCEQYIIGKSEEMPEFEINQKINSDINQIHEIILDKPQNIFCLYTKRLRSNNPNKIVMVGYNEKNEKIVQSVQVNNKDRLYVGFVLEDVKEVYKIEFFDEDMNGVYVQPQFIFGVSR